MSTMGKGAPLDALDAVCKAYKECQKCARQRFGEMCIGEFVRYGMEMVNGYPVCDDAGDSCGRALCECDKKFAQGKRFLEFHKKEFRQSDNSRPRGPTHAILGAKESSRRNGSTDTIIDH